MREDRFSSVDTVAGGSEVMILEATWERRRLY